MEISIPTMVYHKIYGYGEVIKSNDEKIYVDFNGKKRIFDYPEAIIKEYLVAANVEINSTGENISTEENNRIGEKTKEIISYENQYREAGLNDSDNWKGDPRGRFETMFDPIIEGSEYHFKRNTKDSSSKILEFYRNDEKKRIMGFAGRRDMTISIFFNSDFCDYIRKSVILPENRNPKKRQPQMNISLNKLWNVLCAATGKKEYMIED